MAKDRLNPFIGEEYEKTRLLLIGESHYVPEKDVHCVDRDDFYEVSFDDLEDGEYKGWICTRQVFDYRVYERRDFKIFFLVQRPKLRERHTIKMNCHLKKELWRCINTRL